MSPHFSERSVQIFAENRLREAIEQGKFDNLAGAGKPIPDLDAPYDPDWWLKKKIQEDDISGALRDYQRMVLHKSKKSP